MLTCICMQNLIKIQVVQEVHVWAFSLSTVRQRDRRMDRLNTVIIVHTCRSYNNVVNDHTFVTFHLHLSSYYYSLYNDSLYSESLLMINDSPITVLCLMTLLLLYTITVHCIMTHLLMYTVWRLTYHCTMYNDPPITVHCIMTHLSLYTV